MTNSVIEEFATVPAYLGIDNTWRLWDWARMPVRLSRSGRELFPLAWKPLFSWAVLHFLTANRIHFSENCSRTGIR